MEVDKETKAEILGLVGPIITSVAMEAIVVTLTAVTASLVVTNYKKSNLTGDTEMHPTKDEVALSKSEAAASETEGTLAQDTVAGVNGEVKASETEARAMTSEATAADSGASALRTKVGASDIETKALKMT
jgi:FlaG/FlaF family flagellin (archaellin)